MVIQGIILFAIVLLIVFVVFSNLIMNEARKQNKVKKRSAMMYMSMSILVSMAIVSSIWKFIIN
ncbi:MULTISPECIES: hypothetical protein [unclassified Bacillus (in: firmicutes)]|uniref:hypothetical protein n=1 Tax=unclassified Bacillus (in: firmicutes) TaxID=185979 RepID=UPI000D035A4B|nr:MULTISPECIES: hypothetical protein [unclassified Bacillus (in: firmicutes)]PRR88572.1 hypothetical protein C6W21_17660 [Bacillus sp. NMCN1]PRR96349.1 hypothetical protein C6W20_17300 [Bacillus sp. NMCN6]